MRARFRLPSGKVYLVGHSLGPLSDAASGALANAEEAWADDIVASWNKAGWIDLAETTGAKIAPLIGVEAEEVVICDSVSVNLFKLIGALAPAIGIKTILVENEEFPTDQYIAEQAAALLGIEIRKARAGEGVRDLEPDTLLIKSVSAYRDAALTDVASAERRAEDVGGAIIWDLSHAAGVVSLALNRDGARFATGCTYKYLNAGPGAPSFVYIRKDWAGKLATPLPGWLGHAQPFAMSGDYSPAGGVKRFIAGTPPILSLAALGGALSLFEGISPDLLAAKAGALGDRLIAGLVALGLRVVSPTASAERGGHVSFLHPDGYAVVRALAAEGVEADYREPGTIRFGLSPMYLSHEDIERALMILADILETRRYDDPAFRVRAKVT
jgi:kynureninase